MIIIYHLGQSQSDRIVWLMEELGLPYALEWYDRGDDGLAPADYLALHPAATSPMIRDGELILPESSAIVEYICHKYADGRLTIDPGNDYYPHYLYWLQLNNNLISGVFARHAVGTDANPENMILKVVQRRENGYFDYLEQWLGKVAYLAGEEFTCVDIMAIFPLTTMMPYMDVNLDEKPNIRSYVDRITSRPAYIKAMSIAGVEATRPSA